MERSSSMFKAKCQLETLVKNKLQELHKLGYTKLQSFEKLLAHIAPENVNISLKEIEIAGAMQLYNLERAYAVNALTISNELISLRRNRGMDMLQALDLLQQRVSSMRSVPYKPPAPRRPASAPLGASAGGASVGAGAGRVQRQLADEDCHVEKRRRLSKHACSGHGSGSGGSAALAAMAAMAAAAAVAAGGGGAPAAAGSGNEENELRAEKRPSSGSGSGGGGGGGAGAAGGGAAAAASAAAVAEDMADFKRARKER